MGKRQTFNDYKILNDKEAEFYIINKKKEQFTVTIDREDLDRLIEFGRPWHIVFNVLFYVQCCQYLKAVDGKPTYNIIYLHRWLLNCSDKKMMVDHIDHNTFNNRKENLRISEVSDNAKHRNTKNKNNRSGYRNVCWLKNESKWAVQLSINGKNTRLAKFHDLEEAHLYAEKMRNEIYGEYAGNA